MTHIDKYLLTILGQDGSIQAEIPIFIIPNEPTQIQVQDLRVRVERTADPHLYFFCAWAFTLADMPTAAERMREKGLHYKALNENS